MSEDAIEHRVDCGRLFALRRGVYAVGHKALTRESFLVAAVLACGRKAFLSHRSAAVHWRSMTEMPSSPQVTVNGRTKPRRRGIDGFSSILADDEVTTRLGIPVTSYPRTLLDLAAILRPEHLALAFTHAEQRPYELKRLARLLERHPRRPGTPALRALLQKHGRAIGMTRSEFEREFLVWLDAHGLPRPSEVNALIKLDEDTVYMPDCLWRDQRVIVELDTWLYHGTPTARAADGNRDIDLQNLGYKVFRVTPQMLGDDLARRLALALA